MINNLPHIITRHILSFVDSPFDKICFVLATKRLYENRERFLYFDASNLKTQHIGYHHLKSFRKNITQSICDRDLNLVWPPTQNEPSESRFDSLDHKTCNIDSIPNDSKVSITFIIYQQVKDGLDIFKEMLSTIKGIIVNIDFDCLKFSTAIPPGLIPKTVKQINLGSHYDFPLEEGILPDGLTHLHLGQVFNQPLKPGDIPQSVQRLTLSNQFNLNIEAGQLPSSLIKLTTGYGNRLSFGKDSLPYGLRKLVLRHTFNYDASLVLPASVTHLSLGSTNNKLLPGSISPFITSLTLPTYYSHSLDADVIPTSCTRLRIHSLQKTLEPRALPESIDTIFFGRDYNDVIRKKVLPNSLTYLNLGVAFNNELVLPKKLKYLRFSSNFNRELEPNQLPNSLRTLIFGMEFNQLIAPGILPRGLTTLQFGIKFNQPIGVGVLPSTLETLILGPNFNQPLEPGVLPEGLQRLEFGDRYSLALVPGVIPSSVTELVLGEFFGQMLIGEGAIPDTVTYLRVPSFQSKYLLSSPTRKIHVQLTKPNFIPMEIRMVDENTLLAIDKKLFGGFLSIENIDHLRDHIFRYWTSHKIAQLKQIHI
ncbi:hypothetical protein PPL_11681 [Heterostelium album PN500]|uniref:FNIP repeat-containing protein n=1 Tax=Heterostelium pallidum (strain ATCC 26659 / Pp 5 / PN500) TaxID=670386 RepID=D3BU62_HETP5|nr:hypothetical protein PPL_11681 [Heterostelium album PN500]EFA75063.1 hypothetical protein PPL_11681 [Heterostelium album PN500]|eukprot:XP_020427197.1 hypothetical protein PPL_11681 [Heterostelium album PN500]